jgi:hypothetical protein
MNLENLTHEEQKQYNQFLQQFMQNIDPTDYLPPSKREIARMDMETLQREYEMVRDKTSERSSTQRMLITQRYEYELTKTKSVEDEQN